MCVNKPTTGQRAVCVYLWGQKAGETQSWAPGAGHSVRNSRDLKKTQTQSQAGRGFLKSFSIHNNENQVIVH